jgi:hypothetical protein
MNKMKKYLMMFAALVATTVGFTACSSDDGLASAEQEGSGVVKTDFTISFPKQMSGTTRQTTKIVQGQDKPVFRGITGIELMPFTAAKSGINASSTIPSSINLAAGTVGKQGASSATANTIDAQYALYPNSNSHLYTDIEIAIGTRAFMFYGKAIDAATSVSTSNVINGSLVKSVAPSGTTLDAISFSLTNITTATVDAQATAIAAYLTNIAKANSGTETMLTYFPNFTNLKAGSYTSMKAVVQAVYTSLYNNTDALSTAIKTAILDGYKPSGASAKTISVAEKSGTTTGELVFTSDYSYPRNLYLPDGAARINWNATTLAFDVVTTSNVGLDISALTDYTYPAALYYYGLSDIWAVPASMSGLYDDNKTWADIVKEYTDRNDESATVQSTTRSIAIRDEVQYAVGRLDVTVESKNGATTLKDNSNVDIALGTNGAYFPIKGVLVGNQKAVKYNFETNPSAAAKTIYDSQMPTEATLYPGSPTVKTHTLVLQTVDATSDDDQNANVRIAIEFENAGTQIIVGKDNELIYPGTRFYLIGTLKPNLNTTQKYSTDANAAVIKKAFVQDYVTTANFTVESFKNAYHTLPDLRTPSLEIGLSVDLTWKTGITQGITIQ